MFSDKVSLGVVDELSLTSGSILWNCEQFQHQSDFICFLLLTKLQQLQTCKKNLCQLSVYSAACHCCCADDSFLVLVVFSDPFELASYTSSMHAVMYNPAEPRLLATANAKEGVGLWDIRKPRR